LRCDPRVSQARAAYSRYHKIKTESRSSLAALIALRGLKRGVQQDTEATATDRVAQLRGEKPEADGYPARW